MLPELKIIPGFALDLTTADADGLAWDFDEKEMRDRALERVRREQPMLLVGSPMCTAFSTWQRINIKIRDPVTVAAELKRVVMNLEFCVVVPGAAQEWQVFPAGASDPRELVADRHYGQVHARARRHKGDLRSERL